MREFKFRAWDGRKMFNVETLEFSDVEGIVVTTDGGYIGYAGSDYKLMQSTGLSDKNGREIWQGDILDASYTNPMTGEKITKLYIVIPGDDKCDACKAKHFKNRLYDTPLFLVNSRAKVVGNIFENPDLLETEARK